MNHTRRLGTIALTGLSVTLLAACAAPPSAPSAAVAPAPLPAASAVPVAAIPTPAASPVATPSPITTASPTPTDVPMPVAATVSSAAPSATAVEAAVQRPPHFDTPEAAMRYLVDAYNAHDMKAERHVTTPDSRDQLETERQWVNTFRFNSCGVDGGTAGHYICTFDMVSMVPSAAPSASSDASQMNEITVLVGPAKTPGWYMYANEGCGDAKHG